MSAHGGKAQVRGRWKNGIEMFLASLGLALDTRIVHVTGLELGPCTDLNRVSAARGASID